MHVIRIKNLKANTILGVYDWEKTNARPVLLNIEMRVDEDTAGNSDDVRDAVDYDRIEQGILKRLENTSYNLIERLVDDIGGLVLLLDARIAGVTVEADKPGALKHADSVSVMRQFIRD